MSRINIISHAILDEIVKDFDNLEIVGFLAKALATSRAKKPNKN